MTTRDTQAMRWGSNQIEAAAAMDAEVAPDLWMFGGFGNVAVAVTSEGLVIIDTSSRNHAKEIIKRLRARTQSPIHTIVLTHGHTDHAGGVGIFLKDATDRKDRRPRVIAHELVPVRFNRYKMTSGHQLHMNMVQYGGALQQGYKIDYNARPFLPPDMEYPDITYRDAMQFKVGELTFELYHSKGETDDQTWVYIPERKTVVGGDTVHGSMPNIGNPFKLMLRYETEWAEAMERVAGLNPEYIIPGHTPLMKKEQAREVCLEQAAFLRWCHDEVLGLMNQGYWLEEILEKVKMPEKWTNKPYLGQQYGCLSFVVHGIYNRYGGWYNGHPADLFPSKRADIAAAVVKLSGAEALMQESQKLLNEGNPQLALHLVDYAVEGAQDKAVLKKALVLKARMLDARAQIEINGMAKNTFLRGAEAAEQEAKNL